MNMGYKSWHTLTLSDILNETPQQITTMAYATNSMAYATNSMAYATTGLTKADGTTYAFADVSLSNHINFSQDFKQQLFQDLSNIDINADNITANTLTVNGTSFNSLVDMVKLITTKLTDYYYSYGSNVDNAIYSLQHQNSIPNEFAAISLQIDIIAKQLNELITFHNAHHSQDINLVYRI